MNENEKKAFVDFNNNLTLTGFVCKDIELSETSKGKAMAKIMLNVKQGKDKDDKDIYEPVFIKAYGDKAKTVADTYHKKDLVTVSGKLSTFFDEGKYAIDIVLTDIEKFKAKEKSETVADSTHGKPMAETPKKKIDKEELDR